MNSNITVYSAAGNIIGLSSANALPSKTKDLISDYNIDQLILFNPKKHPTPIQIFNADLSTATQCGNGLRALAYHLGKKNHLISIQDTIYETIYQNSAHWVSMHHPSYIKTAYVGSFPCTVVHIGNDHAIFDRQYEPHLFDIKKEIGLSHNISFIHKDKDSIWIKTHERGANWTGACASASCAAVSIYARSPSCWEVHNPGGILKIQVTENTILQRGPIELIAQIDI